MPDNVRCPSRDLAKERDRGARAERRRSDLAECELEQAIGFAFLTGLANRVGALLCTTVMFRAGHFGRDCAGSKARLAHSLMHAGRHDLRRPGDRERKNHEKNDKQVPARNHRFRLLESELRRNRSLLPLFPILHQVDAP